MARDIVERLRRSPERARLCEDAANAIEQRDREIEQLRAERNALAEKAQYLEEELLHRRILLRTREATADTEPPAAEKRCGNCAHSNRGWCPLVDMQVSPDSPAVTPHGCNWQPAGKGE